MLIKRHLFGRLTWPPIQNAFCLSPAPSQNFRGTFAQIFLSADPSHQQGAHQRKSTRQRPWCLALAKAHFWKLGCCIWSLFLETSESNVRQCQQGCASNCDEASPLEARLLLPMKGMVNVLSTAPHSELNQNQTKILRYPFPAGAAGGRGW